MLHFKDNFNKKIHTFMIIGKNLSYCNVYKIYKPSHIKSKSKKVFWFLPLFLFVSLFSLFFFCLFFGQKFFRWLTPFLSILFCFERKHFTVLEKKKSTSSNNFSKKAILKISSISNSNNEPWILYRVFVEEWLTSSVRGLFFGFVLIVN